MPGARFDYRVASSDVLQRVRVLEAVCRRFGVPLIDGALVNLECRVEHSHDHGSHTIYVGYVDVAHVADKRPLLYYDGAYRDVG